jgi:hypothetical protein
VPSAAVRWLAAAPSGLARGQQEHVDLLEDAVEAALGELLRRDEQRLGARGLVAVLSGDDHDRRPAPERRRRTRGRGDRRRDVRSRERDRLDRRAALRGADRQHLDAGAATAPAGLRVRLSRKMCSSSLLVKAVRPAANAGVVKVTFGSGKRAATAAETGATETTVGVGGNGGRESDAGGGLVAKRAGGGADAGVAAEAIGRQRRRGRPGVRRGRGARRRELGRRRCRRARHRRRARAEHEQQGQAGAGGCAPPRFTRPTRSRQSPILSAGARRGRADQLR